MSGFVGTWRADWEEERRRITEKRLAAFQLALTEYGDLYEWTDRQAVRVLERERVPIAADDVLSAHDALRTTDRIPSEWMDGRFA